MLEEGREVLGAARAWVAAIDPGSLSNDDASGILDIAVALEALGAGLTLLVAARAAAGTDWEAQGHRSPAGWLAEATRSSVPSALATLRAAEQLSELPATADAVRAGRLSALEARVISAAAAAVPDAEGELLQAVDELPVGEFTRVARQVVAAGRLCDGAARASVHRRRFLRFRTGTDGELRLSGAFAPEDGAALYAAVRSRSVHVADEAMAAGVALESQEAYDADALVALALGDRRRATFGGQEPIEPAWWASVDDGLCSHGDGGRGEATSVAEVPTSVAEVLGGGGCVVPGCCVVIGLEMQHPSGGPARPDGADALVAMCRPHRRLLTYEGYELRGCPGGWDWVPPAEPAGSVTKGPGPDPP